MYSDSFCPKVLERHVMFSPSLSLAFSQNPTVLQSLKTSATQPRMAVFCFCSNYNSTLIRKTRASVSNLNILPLMDRSRVLKSTIRWSSCPLFCLCLIIKDIQTTSPEKHGAPEKPEYAQIGSDLFCPKSKDHGAMFFSLSLASRNPTASRRYISKDQHHSAMAVFCFCSKKGRNIYEKKSYLPS
jgi:hypothetical protein